jgi:hypothetical protein
MINYITNINQYMEKMNGYKSSPKTIDIINSIDNTFQMLYGKRQIYYRINYFIVIKYFFGKIKKT